VNDWDPRHPTDDDYIDPADAVASNKNHSPNPKDDFASAPAPQPPLFTPPSNDELFTGTEGPVPHDSNDVAAATPLVPPPNDALFRRPPRRPDVSAVKTAESPLVGAKPDTGKQQRDRKTVKAVAILAGVVTMMGAGAIFAVASALSDDDDVPLAEAFPATTTSKAPTTTAPPAPPFCTDPNPDDDVVVTNEPGDRNSAVGVITAFEYRYYADRDAVKVVETYDPALQMDPAGIQPFIDKVPLGSKHCMTIEPSDKPNEFRVTGELKSPNSALTEPIDMLLFTTAPSPNGWMITSVLDPESVAA
jgi:hypothetical protein